MLPCKMLQVFNGAETNCGIAHSFGILMMNWKGSAIRYLQEILFLWSVPLEYTIVTIGHIHETDLPKLNTEFTFLAIL